MHIIIAIEVFCKLMLLTKLIKLCYPTCCFAILSVPTTLAQPYFVAVHCSVTSVEMNIELQIICSLTPAVIRMMI